MQWMELKRHLVCFYKRFIVKKIVSRVQTKRNHLKFENKSVCRRMVVSQGVQLNKLLASNRIVAQSNVFSLHFILAFDIHIPWQRAERTQCQECREWKDFSTKIERTTILVSNDNNLLTHIIVMSSRQNIHIRMYKNGCECKPQIK